MERYIQRNVLKAAGFSPSVENLQRFWQIRDVYEEDQVGGAGGGEGSAREGVGTERRAGQEIMGSVIYLRYAHLLHDCSIPLGAAAPDASLVRLDDGAAVALSDYWRAHANLVILAGSMT